MLICRIERCDTLLCTTIAIYRRITITPSDGFTSSCSSTGIYSIPEQVFILAAATIVHLFRTSRRTSAQCPAVVFHSTGFLRIRTRTISDLSVPSAVYRQNLQSLLPASSTLQYPVAPRVPRASHRIASHRIASQRGLSFLLNRTVCFLDDKNQKDQRRVLHC